MLHIIREYFFVNGLLHKKAWGKFADREDIEYTEFPDKDPV
jgi:hypothetical protein